MGDPTNPQTADLQAAVKRLRGYIKSSGNPHWFDKFLSEHLDVVLSALATVQAERDEALAMRTAANTDAASLARIQLLADVELHLQSCRVFLTSREKMHPHGIELHDELLGRVTAAINEEDNRG